MPRVPSYGDTPAVAPGIRQDDARTALTPDAASLPGRQMQQFGAQLSEAGAILGDAALKAQQEVNRARANEALNAIERQAQDFERAYRELKGANAAQGINGMPLADYYTGEFERSVAGVVNGLPNEFVRRQVSEMAADRLIRFRGQAINWEGEQAQVYADQVDNATITSSFEFVAANPRSPEARIHLARARDAARAFYERQGFAGDALSQQVREALGKQHGVILAALLDQGKAGAAQAYLAANKQDFLAQDYQAWRGKVSTGVSASTALSDVDRLLAEMPIDPNNIPVADLDARLRAMVGGDESRLRAARAELGHRMRLLEEQGRNEQNAAYDTAARMMQESPALALGSAAFQSLTPDRQRALITGAAGATPEQELAYAEMTLRQGWGEELGRMNQSQVQALRPLVGDDNFRRILTDYERIQSGINDVDVRTDEMRALASEFGLNPEARSASALEEMRRFYLGARQIVAAEQKRLGRELSFEEREAVVRRAMANSVTVPGTIWSSEVPLLLATPEQIAEAEDLAMEEADISEDDRDRIKALLTAAYQEARDDPSLSEEERDRLLEAYNPSYEENIRRFYVREQRRAP